MDKIDKISAIIPFRDRDIDRLFYLYDSFDSDDVIEFIVVDYGSKVPLRLKNISKNRPKFKIIRSECSVWNKAHALNIGIKKAKGEFIMTIDLDIVLVDKLNIVLDKKCFYYSSNVHRINKNDLEKTFPYGWDNSFSWYPNTNYASEIFGLATGGLQIYSKDWIDSWKGIDENLVYMGGMDNITIMMAKKTEKIIIQLPNRILHIEHENKKEKNFEGKESLLALFIQSKKREYLNNWIVNPRINKSYGNKNPDCPMLKIWEKDFHSKKIINADQNKKILISVISNRSSLPTIFVKSLIPMLNYTTSIYPRSEMRFVRAAEISNMRNLAVKLAIEDGFDYLICLDDDHVLQEDTVIKLMSHNKDFVTVPTKQRITPFTPTQFKEFKTPIKQEGNFLFVDKGSGDKDNLIECEVSGPVCMLMKVESLKKLKYPYYEMGYKEKPIMSSDFVFAKKLKKKGFKIYVDTTIDCPHIISGIISSFGKDSEITFSDGSF